MAGWGTFEPDIAGIREVLHSAGVQSALMAAAEDVAGSCNSVVRDGAHLTAPPYRAAVDQGKYTSIGVAFTATDVGRHDQAKHGRLDAHKGREF